ncbi:hypothetical protein RES1_11775 [Staphylococcus epidermidis]|uniref:DUF6731 family protein n=1 Tax=Staphylococcus epidermidis TaxID=1282 RepID=UPI00070B2075|nr:DUF6731 family protein [Staphylococcus epidermidis]KSZ60875.1 hypothetical protein RES1_11775 [Staphylococcus epidermidis]PIH33271.1 hypothetical protein CTJ09_12705 [Staphylococcus epidermidis]
MSNENKKTKVITFNVVRLGITFDIEKAPSRLNFEELMKKFDQYQEADAISTIFNGENLIFQQCKCIDLNERLFHIKILKKRDFDLPFTVQKVTVNKEVVENEITDAKTHELDESVTEDNTFNEISYESDYLESTIEKKKDSFIGEILNILFDAQNNILVIQSNKNCTTTKGLEKLFTALYYQLNNVNSNDYAWVSISPIYNPSKPGDLRSLKQITEISFVIEDNNRIRTAEDIAGNKDELLPQRLEIREKINSNDKRKGFNKQKIMRKINYLLRNKSKLKELKTKGREDIDDNLEILDFLKGNLKFTIRFTFISNKSNVLNPETLITDMKNNYLNKKIHGRNIRSIAMNS